MGRWKNSNILACVTAMTLLYCMPVSGSFCVTLYEPKVYAYNMVENDFNNDGILDKYEIFDEHSTIKLSQNGVEFSNIYTILESWALSDNTLKSTYGSPTEIISEDLNNDGYIDIVVALGSRIVVRLNDGNGGFWGNSQFITLAELYGNDELPIPGAKAEFNTKIVAYDFNKDGYSDLAVIHAEGISLYLNDLSGNFTQKAIYEIPGLLGKTIDSAYQADLDQDSYSEIVVSASGSYIVYFDVDLKATIVSISNHSDKISLVEYDGDGDFDFLEEDSYDGCNSSNEKNEIIYWINTGQGGFEEKIETLNVGIEEISPSIVYLPSPTDDSSNNKESSSGGSLSYVFLIGLLFLSIAPRLTNRCYGYFDRCRSQNSTEHVIS